MYDFPFTIRQVAEILHLKIRHDKGYGKNMDVDCPFCDKKGKMNLNAYKNVFRCNYCGEYGGMIALYGKIHGLRNGDAYKEICGILGIDNQNSDNSDDEKSSGQCSSSRSVSIRSAQTVVGSGSMSQSRRPIPPEPPKRADAQTIHQTYSTLLSMLSLSEPHRDNLLSRGLSSDDIVKHGYKSVPTFGQQGLCDKLMQAGCIIEGVPGFYKEMIEVDDVMGVNEGVADSSRIKDTVNIHNVGKSDGIINRPKKRIWNGKWNVKLNAPGILIPIYGMDGKIAALQIRLNKVFSGRKYIWLSSSDLEGGASSGAPIHFIGDPNAKRVFVTEGALKGNIAYSLSGHTFVCIAGANNLGGMDAALSFFRDNGIAKEIVEALDMDKVLVISGKPMSNEGTLDKNFSDQNPSKESVDHVREDKNDNRNGLNSMSPNVAAQNMMKNAVQKGNVHIATAARNLRDKISAYGFITKSAVWDDREGLINGIDDHFLAKIQSRQRMACGEDIPTSTVTPTTKVA
ncbi:MAG: hypothetical protein FWD97_05005 [Defluviitaleaceae bacterium]|nr:hypothetical protein [Defluviitaleaceae bacterium]